MSSSSSNLTRASTLSQQRYEIRTEQLTAPVTTRPRTFSEQQPYILGYGGAISLVAPFATAYQLCRLYHVTATPLHLLKLSASIIPQQTLLKTAQMNLTTPVKEHLHPIAAFAVVGILQGGIYGHANLFFSRRLLQLSTATVSIVGMFRGSGFAAGRDMISQGLPFVGSDIVRCHILDRLLPCAIDTQSQPLNNSCDSVKQWTAVLATSFIATYLSQGLHNCQIAMQANPNLLSHTQAVQNVWQQHGCKLFYKGAEARVGLLLLVNALNELLLKPAWAPVPI